MQNYLPKRSQESEVKIRVVINTFSGNSIESDQSTELIRILKQKKIKIYEIIDINQELVFESERKIRGKIREHYHQIGKIFKVNSKFTLPQVIINESLILTFNEFSLLNESRLFEKISAGVICDHIRFYDNKIVYAQTHEEEGVCIYCYSMKKTKQTVVYLCNQRDYLDETNHELFSFCEKNQITMKIIDLENISKNNNSHLEKYRPYLENKENCLYIDDDYVQIECFYDALEKRFTKSSSLQCKNCGSKISADSSLGLKKCFECLLGVEKNENYKEIGSSKSDLKKKRRNYSSSSYSFIEKLGLRKKNFNFDYEFGDAETY